MQQTKLNRKWKIKIAVFFLAAIGLMVWGLVDATYYYPKRGETHADFALMKHMEAAQDAGRLNAAVLRVDDPPATLAALAAEKEELAGRINDTSNVRAQREARVKYTRYQWLNSLKNLWALDTANERIDDDVRGQLAELQARKMGNPKPLSGWDLPLQWLFAVVGATGAVLIVINFVRSASRKYAWDETTKTLTLPCGKTIRADDIEAVDKRKWHKFFVTLELEGGEKVTLDLLKYEPLEAWVIELEEEAFPEVRAERLEAEAAAKREAEAQKTAEPENNDTSDDAEAESIKTESE